MKIILAEINIDLIKAWTEVFKSSEDIEIYLGSAFEPHTDAIVSPANSFGFMDGGIDLQISQNLGWDVEERLQELIRKEHNGELLVGQAELVRTRNLKIPYVISAPTMRVPMTLENSPNPFLATRAVLQLIKNNEEARNNIKTVTFPGMGTGVGQVKPEICAYQMYMAVEEVLYGRKEFPKDLWDAQWNHQDLFGFLGRVKNRK
jgi:O-acetyl-ADP-ribose deacetylase (regulator of RNase III)